MIPSNNGSFIRVSPRDSRYLEYDDGTPYVPIGMNIAAPQSQSQLEHYFQSLSRNNGNFARIWLSTKFYDVESIRSGEYDEVKAERIDQLFETAREHDIHIKLCFEHFRNITGDDFFTKLLHHSTNGGPATDMTEFFMGEQSREQFKRKIQWFADRYGDDPIVFGWELWNEIDAVRGEGWKAWTKEMLTELQNTFPHNLCMQSLGSFDREDKKDTYRWLCELEKNDIAQVHRYLDLGASWEICHEPMDVLAVDAVKQIRQFSPDKPALLAEVGGVEPNHSGPFEGYDNDEAGILLHDALFAPLFVGAAGPGHNWHWDHYVDAQDLWHHFDRFATAIQGIEFPAEAFEPIELTHPELRMYCLQGNSTTIAWCRDTESTWRSEIERGESPRELKDIEVEMPSVEDGQSRVRAYDPWGDVWHQLSSDEGTVTLPRFSRSIIVRSDKQ